MPTSLHHRPAPSRALPSADPESALGGANAVIVGTLEGIITSWSPEAERLTGYSKENMLGRPLSILELPERTPEGEPVLERLRRGEAVRRLCVPLKHQSGRILQVWLAMAPLWDSRRRRIVGFSVLAEEDRQRQERIALPSMIEQLPLGMRWVSSDGKIIRANREALALLGYSSDEYVGHYLSEFHPDPGTVQTILEHLEQGEPLRDFEARLRAKDGSIKTVLITSSVVQAGEEVLHAECFTRDIT